MNKRIKRLKAISEELFTMANSFAGNNTGTAAVELHRVTNTLNNAIRILTEGPTTDDKKSQIREHLRQSPCNRGSTNEELERMVDMWAA